MRYLPAKCIWNNALFRSVSLIIFSLPRYNMCLNNFIQAYTTHTNITKQIISAIAIIKMYFCSVLMTLVNLCVGVLENSSFDVLKLYRCSASVRWFTCNAQNNNLSVIRMTHIVKYFYCSKKFLEKSNVTIYHFIKWKVLL